jgi:hypothetical protein
MSEQLEALIVHAARWYCEGDRIEVRWHSKVLQEGLEKSLPADVPLHKRGFGVMDEGGA